MLQIGPQQKIYVAVEPVDFRKGIDGLAALCRQKLDQDPLSGAVFLFCNRRQTSLKLLVYDGQGFWLCLKRFSQGRLRWWPTASGGAVTGLAAGQLQILLWNGHPERAALAPLWRPLAEPLSRGPADPANCRGASAGGAYAPRQPAAGGPLNTRSD
jgi:transposase